MGSIMGRSEMEMQPPTANGDRLFSIGHSHHELPRLVELLRQAGVTAVADVRSRPYSGRHPHFNRPELAEALKQHGIAYFFLGDTLGGRPEAADLYDADGRVNYERVRRTTLFQQGLERLVGMLNRYRIAMLCSEEDPLDCHRGLMIAPALVPRGLLPQHVRGDGRVETTAEVESRLLAETKVGDGILDGLFAADLSAAEHQELLAEAYRLMAQRKAFRLRAHDGVISRGERSFEADVE